MPSTVFFTGHMIDRPGRAAERFPAQRTEHVTARIKSELDRAGASEGFASAACGGDLLFHEAMLERGGRAHVVLPCEIESFRRDCVDVIPDADWGARFDRVLAVAASVEVLGEQYASDNATASECCNRVMVGLARRTALARGEEPLVLALWDGRPGDAVGGTHSAVQFCVRHGLPVHVMMDLAPGGGAETRILSAQSPSTASTPAHTANAEETPQQICAVVFADAVGFSKLKERQVPAFVRFYLNSAMEALLVNRIVPLVKNTWGDGLYLVFESVREAGIFALQFRDRVLTSDFAASGLPYRPNVRIAAHAGPLYRIYDPVIGQWSFIGTHVTRAARLEPSTDPGKVFATLSFAALAAAERVEEFQCVPVGKRQLVKDAGELVTFEILAN